MIRIDLSGLRPVLANIALHILAFKTMGLHRSAPYWRYAAIRRAELRSPSRPHRRLS